MSAGREAVVVGAGVVGLCAALCLQERGWRVRVLDRVEPGSRDSCSFGNAGVLSSWSCEPWSMPGTWASIPGWLLDPLGPVALRPRYLPRLAPWLLEFVRAGAAGRVAALSDAMFALNHPSVDLYRQLLRGTGHEGLIVDSCYLHVSRHARALDVEAPGWRLRREHGAPLEVLSGDEVREAEPDISPAYVGGVRIAGQGRTVNPGRLVEVLADKARAQGAALLRAEVLDVAPRPGGGARLETGAGPVEAPWCVIAAGAWSHRLAARLGCRIPIESERGYHAEFADPGVRLTHSVSDLDRRFAASSMEGGLRCAGTTEFNGLEAGPDWRRSRILARLGRELLPGLNVESASEWMGHRPSTPDTVPVIGPVPGHPGIVLACGHGHLGLTGAPMTGRIVASLASGEPLNIDLAAYRADRFGRG